MVLGKLEKREMSECIFLKEKRPQEEPKVNYSTKHYFSFFGKIINGNQVNLCFPPIQIFLRL